MKAPLSPEDLARVEALVSQHLGMRVDACLRERLLEALGRRLRREGGSAGRWLQRLETPDACDAELRGLAQDLTVGETYFFRGRDHFRALAETVLPERLAARAVERRLRVLSAGCASGEEAYSIAILLRERMPDFAAWQVEITGIDLNTAALDKARRGSYTEWSLRDLPPEQIRRYFQKSGSNYQLDPAIRSLVTFREGNLASKEPPWSGDAGFDLVFCRNVLIYFTQDGIQHVVQRLQSSLACGGYLFLGHSETLRGFAVNLELCQTEDTFYYRARPAGSANSSPLADWLWSLPPLEDVAAPETADDVDWSGAIERSSRRIESLADRTPALPDSREPAAPAQASSLETMRTLLGQERYVDAVDWMARHPESGNEARLLLAAAHTSLGDTAQAAAICSKLLVNDPEHADALCLLALCHEHEGRSEDALEHALRSAGLDPSFAMPHLIAGRSARRRGDRQMARRELAKALELFGGEDSVRMLLFGGGFGRHALLRLCQTQLAAVDTP